ncbi:uncharacterized protein LOC109711597 [Ananas comosus]|uniref:Uncharacterized protein LOC109711597 n=1 Tax=Ananas comosus TaxID=4615 RepID=A0A6P5F2Z7_ANACO|nr:uncharacterized protein LOC109711597 [Ananas comosus]
MAEDDDKPSPSGRSDAAASATTPPQPETEAAESKADDRLNEEHGSPNQRFDIRNVSSTLGLHLTKSQSLLDSIQRTLDEQANAAASVTNDGNSVTGKKRKAMPNNGNGTRDRLKASNFPAKRLTIGDWSFTSTYESDLMAKIYFAKRKLVWEVLDSGGLKNKMEIRWSDISAIKATYPEDGLGTLDVALARRPFFFRETDPQPRRHTVWQSTADFTGGRASTYRRHFLECPSDLLSKNFGKLFQFDAKLNILSQQGAAILDSPDELQCLIFEDQVEPQMCNVPKILDKYYAHSCIFADPQFGSTSMFLTPSGLGKASEFVPQSITLPRSETISLIAALTRIFRVEIRTIVTGICHIRTQAPTSCVLKNMKYVLPAYRPLLFPPTNTQTVAGNAFSEMQYLLNPNFSGQYNVHRLQGSVRPDSFVNQMNHGISEQTASCGPSSDNEMLGYLIQCLLDDTHDVQGAYDEKSVVSTIDFLHCLIQEHPASTAETANSDGTSTVNNSYGTNEVPNSSSDAGDDGPPTAISREEESHGDLLTQIPRVASMPQIFRLTSEDSDNRVT